MEPDFEDHARDGSLDWSEDDWQRYLQQCAEEAGVDFAEVDAFWIRQTIDLCRQAPSGNDAETAERLQNEAVDHFVNSCNDGTATMRNPVNRNLAWLLDPW